MSFNGKYTVPVWQDGLRLDKALVELTSDYGLRLRRRLCEEGRVQVDGFVRQASYKVHAGQEVEMCQELQVYTAEDLGVSITTQSGLFATVSKPGGIHSAVVAGKSSRSVETVLPGLFPGVVPILLNRLDYLTSGLLLVAINADGEILYREMESTGRIEKFYLAVVRGRFDGFETVKKSLDMDDRRNTRVLKFDDPDERRWTNVEAVSHDHDAGTTLVRCLIMKGARHQIRAHLASIGHPIIGDPVYGGEDEQGALLLHHERIRFPGFSSSVAAPF